MWLQENILYLLLYVVIDTSFKIFTYKGKENSGTVGQGYFTYT